MHTHMHTLHVRMYVFCEGTEKTSIESLMVETTETCRGLKGGEELKRGWKGKVVIALTEKQMTFHVTVISAEL